MRESGSATSRRMGDVKMKRSPYDALRFNKFTEKLSSAACRLSSTGNALDRHACGRSATHDQQAGSHYEIITPRHPEARGCQLSILVRNQPRELLAALTEHGVSGDFREPNIIRGNLRLQAPEMLHRLNDVPPVRLDDLMHVRPGHSQADQDLNQELISWRRNLA